MKKVFKKLILSIFLATAFCTILNFSKANAEDFRFPIDGEEYCLHIRPQIQHGCFISDPYSYNPIETGVVYVSETDIGITNVGITLCSPDNKIAISFHERSFKPNFLCRHITDKQRDLAIFIKLIIEYMRYKSVEHSGIHANFARLKGSTLIPFYKIHSCFEENWEDHYTITARAAFKVWYKPIKPIEDDIAELDEIRAHLKASEEPKRSEEER